MTGIPKIELNEEFNDSLMVHDSTGTAIVGLVNANFTRDLYDPALAEVSGVVIITITEMGTGKYEVSFTPTSIGQWTLTIYHAVYFPEGKIANYICEVGADPTTVEIADAVWDEDLDSHISGITAAAYLNKATKSVGGGGMINYYGLSDEDKEFFIDIIKGLILDLKKSCKTQKILKNINEKMKTIKSFQLGNNSLDKIISEINSHINFSDIKQPDQTDKIDKMISELTEIKDSVEMNTKILSKTAPDDIISEVYNDDKE